ncbi:M15 family metallopeptidase [Colwelliaceae bacterium 6441]
MNNKQVTGQTDEHIHWFSPNVGIHKEVVQPWEQLCQAANKQGFELTIASGFRSFDRQLSIWNRKFVGELTIKDIDNNHINIAQLSEKEIIRAILTFSALPGASRHHWGTDIDFYDKNLLKEQQSLMLEPWEYQAGGPFYSLSQWLKNNAKSFGFYFPYDVYRGGIAAEPWHLSYFPQAKLFEKNINHSLLQQCLSTVEISGKTSLIAMLDDIILRYIKNIGEIDNG